MPRFALPVIPLALVLPVSALADTPVQRPSPTAVQVTQLTIQQRIVIRVPRMTVVPQPAAATASVVRPAPIRWKETKGPRCLPAQGMAGALISAPNQVDLVLVGGKRVRARLDGDCKPLDFYSGFYVRPSKDGMICADRDAIRVRSGAACRIDRFRALQPAK